MIATGAPRAASEGGGFEVYRSSVAPGEAFFAGDRPATLRYAFHSSGEPRRVNVRVDRRQDGRGVRALDAGPGRSGKALQALVERVGPGRWVGSGRALRLSHLVSGPPRFPGRHVSPPRLQVPDRRASRDARGDRRVRGRARGRADAPRLRRNRAVRHGSGGRARGRGRAQGIRRRSSTATSSRWMPAVRASTTSTPTCESRRPQVRAIA